MLPLPSTVSMVFDGGSRKGPALPDAKVSTGRSSMATPAQEAAPPVPQPPGSSTARGYSAACATDRSRAAAATLARGANPTGAITAAAHTTACGIR